MQVTAEYMVCTDCLMAIANDDYSGLDYHYSPIEAKQRRREIRAGMKRLGWLSPDDRHEEFSSDSCDCCGNHLHGERHGVVSLG